MLEVQFYDTADDSNFAQRIDSQNDGCLTENNPCTLKK